MGSMPVERKGQSQMGQREKLRCATVLAKASANPIGSSELR